MEREESIVLSNQKRNRRDSFDSNKKMKNVKILDESTS